MTQRALILGAAACYAALLGLLIYGLAVHARLESWQPPPLQTAARFLTITSTPHAVDASCAEFAGMGHKLCNAKAKVEVVRAELQHRVAARKQRHVRAPVDRVESAQDPPAQALIPPANVPDQAELLNSSIAIRE